MYKNHLLVSLANKSNGKSIVYLHDIQYRTVLNVCKGMFLQKLYNSKEASQSEIWFQIVSCDLFCKI